MSITVSTPRVDELLSVTDALRSWQSDEEPVPLHPGDLGWLRRFGEETLANAVRVWRRHDDVLAVGLLDGPDLIRIAVAPEMQDDDALAQQMSDDFARPELGVLPEGAASVEARSAAALRGVLARAGWQPDEPWTPLRRDLSHPVDDPGLRIEVAGPDRIDDRVAVHRAAFPAATFTEERWHEMAEGSLYGDARCLVGYDAGGTAVAAVTVWSAGPGRPGLIEPMGVHRDHRGHGYGTAITVAAARALQGLGSSSAIVCTPSSNVGGVAAYRAAGFEALPDVRDLRRPAL